MTEDVKKPEKSEQPQEVKKLKNEDWEMLIDRIQRKGCTPFLGPGVSIDGYNQRAQIARAFAKDFDYPMDDCDDLARVGRFVSVKFSAAYARNKLLDAYQKLPPANLQNRTDPHVVLASLPIPVYVTTNHNDFMIQALKAQYKDPHAELCKWNKSIIETSKFLKERNEPTPAQPVVFHLYGHPQVSAEGTMLNSLVFTEDDYYEFLIKVASDEKAIPLRVRRAMAGTSLLLLGYRMEERDFRVLFHYLLAKPLQVSTDRVHVAVQVPLDEAKAEEQQRKVQEFLARYIVSKQVDIRVYWGTSQDFAAELKMRWEATNRE